MKRHVIALSCCLAITAIFAYAQTADEGYQVARVVAFERVAANAQHQDSSDNYKISLRLGNIIYACHANAPAATFIDWTNGKEFPTRINPGGKTLSVKNPNGEIIEMNIVGKKTPH